MAFRENLKGELEYQDKKVKELAVEAGISRRTIDQYLSSAAKMPSAENAVKIAAALGVSVEYLVTGTEPQKPAHNKSEQRTQKETAEAIRLYKKYRSHMENLEHLSSARLSIVKNLAEVLSKE